MKKVALFILVALGLVTARWVYLLAQVFDKDVNGNIIQVYSEQDTKELETQLDLLIAEYDKTISSYQELLNDLTRRIDDTTKLRDAAIAKKAALTLAKEK